MNILKEITPPENDKAGAIFYDWYDVKEKWEQGTVEIEGIEKKSSHCFLFLKSEMTSVSLNADSFTLKFSGNKSMKFHFKNKEQIKQLAGLIEICLGRGLKVKEHYASLSINHLIKDLA